MADLPTTQLGRTGLEVTRLSYGAMELRGEPTGRPVSDEQAATMLNAVLDAGINLIDTSPDYGASEEHIGAAIAHRRDEYFLASKCGCAIGQPAAPAGESLPHVFTPENVRAGVEQSLRRMRTDHLDLVQFHVSPSQAVLEEEGALDALRDLQREGKVRFLGMSGTLPHLSDHIAMGAFDAFQIPYSALEPEHDASIGAAAEAGAGTIIRGGVARGAPAPDQDPAVMAGAGARPEINAQRRSLWEVAELDELLDGSSRMEFLLRYTLSHPGMHTTIVGTMNPAHLAANVAGAEKGPLSADVYAEASRRLQEAAT